MTGFHDGGTLGPAALTYRLRYGAPTLSPELRNGAMALFNRPDLVCLECDAEFYSEGDSHRECEDCR